VGLLTSALELALDDVVGTGKLAENVAGAADVCGTLEVEGTTDVAERRERDAKCC